MKGFFNLTSSLFFSLSLVIISLPLSVTSQTPSSAGNNGGAWRLLHASVGISAMHMQLLRNNKVVIFDRTDFGRSNLSLPSGKCRRDGSDTALKVDCTAHSLLYDIHHNTIHPLMVQTDTFCSSGSVLPNGTLLQIGGFNDGDHVIRMLDSCNDCDSDWTEIHNYLSIRRWYATDQILPDGRVIVVGGRRQFNYEFYPRSSSEAYNLNFLRETSDDEENNLYPFLHLLPDGHLFIFANTRSISFDYVRNRVVREFPSISGGNPRNYPSSGSSVLLPLQFSVDVNRPVEAEVLVCGGAPRGAFGQSSNGNFVRACNTCGRLRVTEPDPKWIMEVMPMARVMGDMLLLPTGDVLIINGAGSGTAGWERGSDPVTNPVIYAPRGSPNHRFSVMHPSTIPRLYHSSAVLLPDGRILVGGSNPHVGYNFNGVKFPTELSLEAFSPPYLAERYTAVRPTITSANRVLLYRRRLSVEFTVEEYQEASRVSVMILAPPFTTHSFGMNQRMVVLRVIEVRHVADRTYRLMAYGPATAEIAPSGYYLLFVGQAGIPSSGVWVKVQ